MSAHCSSGSSARAPAVADAHTISREIYHAHFSAHEPASRSRASRMLVTVSTIARTRIEDSLGIVHRYPNLHVNGQLLFGSDHETPARYVKPTTRHASRPVQSRHGHHTASTSCDGARSGSVSLTTVHSSRLALLRGTVIYFGAHASEPASAYDARKRSTGTTTRGTISVSCRPRNRTVSLRRVSEHAERGLATTKVNESTRASRDVFRTVATPRTDRAALVGAIRRGGALRRRERHPQGGVEHGVAKLRRCRVLPSRPPARGYEQRVSERRSRRTGGTCSHPHRSSLRTPDERLPWRVGTFRRWRDAAQMRLLPSAASLTLRRVLLGH
jgi:hypothetical protein